jgi:hypothetical protein
MPLKKAPKGASKKRRQSVASANIREMHKSSRFKAVARKFGKARAQRMAVAAGLSAMRGGRKRKRK